MDILKGILLNVGLLFGFLFMINFPDFTSYDKSMKKKVTRGIIFGFSVIVVMMNSWQLSSGVIYDTRSVLVSVVALLFPFETAAIAASLAMAYRIYVGGAGVYAGLLTIFFSFLIGVLWKRFVFRKTKMRPYLELYLFGVLVHIFMLLSQLVIAYPTNIDILKQISAIVMTVYPLAVALIALSIIKHDKRIELQHQLLNSEKKYRTIFDENPLGMFQYDNNGIIHIANEKFAQILRTKQSNLINLNMLELPNKKLVQTLEESLKGKTAIFEDFYESVFSHHRFYTRVQFSPLTADDVQIGGIGIVEDLSEAYENKQTINDLTNYDLLTKLWNRQSFDADLLKRKSSKSMPISLIIGDINTFQIINESFGYETGNIVLRKIASILEKYEDKSIKSYRIGGDEFALILKNTDTDKAYQIVQDLKHKIDSINDFDFNITMSFGIGTSHSVSEDLSIVYNHTISDMQSNKIYDGSSISKKTIDIIMTTLFDKSKRELKHSERVGEISAKIAEALKIGTAFYNKTYLAGKLHDIGKINIDEKILDKPGKLDYEEWVKIKKHPESGFKILTSVPEYLEIASIVLSHHERFDGIGYPNQLKGHDIPLSSRIIGLADAYDAMTETRTYRSAMTKEEAIEEIKRCSGTQFDPDIVDVFLKEVVDNI
ncbi:MAG: diguanylate cyclase [Bacilli bacterium]|nr:diguanylate cyclase [Bacilli bacterium]